MKIMPTLDVETGMYVLPVGEALLPAEWERKLRAREYQRRYRLRMTPEQRAARRAYGRAHHRRYYGAHRAERIAAARERAIQRREPSLSAEQSAMVCLYLHLRDEQLVSDRLGFSVQFVRTELSRACVFLRAAATGRSVNAGNDR